MVFLCVVFKRLWLIVKRPENVKGLCEHIVVKHSIHRWRGWVAFLLVISCFVNWSCIQVSLVN